MKKLSILVIAFVCIFLLSVTTSGETKEEKVKKVPTFDDILMFRSPSSPLISPDGKWVLYTVREADMEENEYRSQIWLVGIDKKQPRQLTFAKKSSSKPQWSPDSQALAFLSAREDKTQVYTMSAFGGEARPLTQSKTGVNDFEWSPDGKFIAFTAEDEENKRDKAIEKKYGKFDVFNEKFGDSHLFILDIQSGKTEKVVDREDLYVSDFKWSPDCRQIVFAAAPDPRAESLFSKTDIYIVQIKDKKISHLVKQEGPDDNPVWSEDGKWIAFNSSLGVEDYFVNTRICMIAAAGGEIINLTPNFNENASLIDWQGKYIWFFAFQGLTAQLFQLDPTTKKISRFTQGPQSQGIIYSGSLSRQGAWISYYYEDAHHCPEVYASRTQTHTPMKLSDFGAQTSDWVLSSKETIQWRSQDGAEITGVLSKPADFDPRKKYPLLVVIHGGPAAISLPAYFNRYGRYYPLEQWAAKGAVILEPNYRGSTGFGENFRKLNYRNMGVGDYWDVISGVDHLVSLGFIDENRVGAMGWSQGGYISAFITTASDRFKAVSVGAGISDWVTYYVNTDIPPFTRIYLGATPWDDEEIYKRTSPMTYINKAKTPTLIQHGEFDKRVPIPNAFKLYRGLKDKGIPVKFIIYKGFGHGITKPRENRAVLKHNFDWFNQYIWNEEPQEETFPEEAEEAAKKE